MKKTLKKTLVFTLLGLSHVKAQTDSSKKNSTSFIFSADAYYRLDFTGQSANNKTSFTNSNNAVELGMASIRIEQNLGKITGTIDLGFGRRADDFSYNDTATLKNLKQVYLTYAASPKIKFTIGKWATHIGYESVDAYANRNYSMSYGFSYGPFFNTGIKTDISLGNSSAIMLGITNPTDYSTTTSSQKVFIAQFSTATKDNALKGFLNYQGSAGKSQFDLVLSGTLSTKLSLCYDGTVSYIEKQNWNSNVIYLNYDPNKRFGLTLREEIFSDKKNITGIGTSVFSSTLSGQIHLENLTIIPEIRFDNSQNQIFIKQPSIPAKCAGNILIAAVYKF
ncbi:MAG: outer membrane beta-barrel protein [Sphingobacteriia bacterium]|nr:outer membrane beta-barrel protein [Sphingobacteriia bacterium]